MDSTISTIQHYPLYRMLSTIQGSPSTGFNVSTIRYTPFWQRMIPAEAAGLSTLGLLSNTDYLSTMNRYIEPLVVEANKGLGNRLKALISGICGADELSKKVHVIWSVTSECGAKFIDLFQPTLPVWVHVHEQLSVACTQHACDTQNQWDSVKSGKAVYLKSGSRFHTTNEAKFNYWLKSLKPVSSIAAAVSTAFAGATGVVGVHLRRTDHTVAITASPNSAFIIAMQAMPSTTKFFVASDSNADRIALETAFPGRILTIAKNLTRNSKEGLQDALKDFVGLSRCISVLGSKDSSFSQMAAAYGGVPLTVISVA